MASVALIFLDGDENEQMRMCFVDTSPPVRLTSGESKAAGSVVIGDVVRLPDGSWRRVDVVEAS